ncbi:hypothetical protein NMY22_g16763 [Coprinellus aureogranulatus]|nr:hypothetical protein NMY22_g16763 [Coprinellus aureogranulatus]
MSTQAIKDFLVKQLFIEKNVVTYRSLSRQFGIHVNAAKEKLACYHEKAPYDGQQSFATYLLTGQVLNPRAIPRASKGKDTSKAENAMDVDDEDDVGLDMFIPTQTDKGDDEGDVDDDDDEEEEEDYEDVMTISVRIVNERDLEDVKATYHKLTSMHVYSLSPSVIHDASHLCGPTTAIRRTDNTKGEEYAQTVGRIIAPNIHIKPLKPKDLPAVPAPSTSIKVEDPTSTSVAGRSVKAMAGQTTNSTTGSSFVKPDVEKKTTPALKKTGKADFFGVVKKKEQDKVPAVKKEEAPAKAEEKKKSGKMFFGASTSKAKETTKPVAVKKEEVEEPLTQAAKPAQRGTKRKSALELSDSENEELPKPRKNEHAKVWQVGISACIQAPERTSPQSGDRAFGLKRPVGTDVLGLVGSAAASRLRGAVGDPTSGSNGGPSSHLSGTHASSSTSREPKSSSSRSRRRNKKADTVSRLPAKPFRPPPPKHLVAMAYTFSPPVLPAWVAALAAIDTSIQPQEAALGDRIGFRVPHPRALIASGDHRQYNIAAWAAIRAVHVSNVLSQTDPARLTNSDWRHAFHYFRQRLHPLSMAANLTVPVALNSYFTQLLVGNTPLTLTWLDQSIRVHTKKTISDSVTDLLSAEVLWDLAELGFRLELLYLDQVMAPRCWLVVEGDNPNRVRDVQDNMIRAVFRLPGDDTIPASYFLSSIPCRPFGLNAGDLDPLRQALVSLRDLMLDWAGCPPTITYLFNTVAFIRVTTPVVLCPAIVLSCFMSVSKPPNTRRPYKSSNLTFLTRADIHTPSGSYVQEPRSAAPAPVSQPVSPGPSVIFDSVVNVGSRPSSPRKDKRRNQFNRWQDHVIPALIQPYLQLIQESNHLRHVVREPRQCDLSN